MYLLNDLIVGKSWDVA